MNLNISKREPYLSQNYVSFSWLVNDGRFAVGTDKGEILLFDEHCEYKGYMTVEIGDWSIECIKPYKRGFIVSGDQATAVIFERNVEDAKVSYIRNPRNIYLIDYPSQTICSFAHNCQAEDTIAVALSNSQILTSQFSTDHPDEDIAFSFLSHLFHRGRINGLDVCLRKSLVATCGIDNTVRIWNSLDRTLEVYERYNEEATAVAIHPSGFHLVVGFISSLKMMNIFSGSIKPYKEFKSKNCHEIRFSHGGHMFAANHGHIVQVYNFYTGESPISMQAKMHTGKVHSIVWTSDDLGFVTAGMDGVIFEWKLSASGPVMVRNFQTKGIVQKCLVMRQESQRELYTVGDDNLVREVIDQECTKQLETGANITQLAVSKCEALLYAGLSEPLLPGSIRCYRFNPFSGDYSEFAAHSGEVTQIAVSYDDSQVITAGSDGTLCFFKVTDREVHHLRREKDKPILPYAEELIIGNEEIKDLTNEISTLTTKIEDKQQRDKLKFEMAIQDKQEKIDQLEQQLDENASTDKVRINTIIQTKTKEEAVAHKTMSQLDTDHQKEMETMVQTNEHKIAIEKARFAELKEMKSTSLAEYKGQCVLIEKNHNVLLDKRENDHIRFLNSKRDELVSLVQQKSALQAQFDVRRTELEEGNEIDLQEIRVADRFDLQYENARNLEAKGNLKLMKKKHSNILVKLQQMKEHIKARKNKTVEQEKVIAQIHKEKGFMKKEILDRDVTVRDKDSKISDLRKKNQELEKFKFVLDYKIKELKREILPREKEIQIMSQQTKEMEKELKHLRGVNENLQLMVDDLKMRQEGMKNQVSNHKDELQFSKTKIEGFKTDVFDAIQYIADYKQLKGAILKVYNKHVTTQPTDKELVPDIQKEYGQQRKYLEKNVTNLKEKISKESQTHRTDNMRFVRHNALLLSEINGLRKEYKSLASVKKQIDIVNSQNATFDNSEMEYKRELKEQASEISTLKARLNQFSSPRPPRAKSTGLKRPRIERLDL